MKRLILLHLSFLFILIAAAQPPANYYQNVDGKNKGALKTALYTIIKGHTDKGYDGLYTTYLTSDDISGKVWDMYSTCTWIQGQKKCGNYANVCDCYNREHSIPQSWFGSSSPMVSDAFHIYPTDGKVNGQRSNFPYGECSSGKTLAGGKGRLGSSSFSGYSGTVFEPDDEYKGDFARTYFYFATRYENIMTSIGGESFNGTVYPALSTWSQSLFLKWSRQDPVSKKELDRNNAIYAIQHNRNPYIDYPELAEFIWGTRQSESFSLATSIDKTFYIPSVFYSNSELNIQDLQSDGTLSIFDMQGKLVKNMTIYAGANKIPIEMNSIFIAVITTNKGTYTKKITPNY
ncbi:MAG: endonuclease [Bacteroidales bacterium]|nr:endonuclease [Bacteroidales bacterium]